MSGCRRRRREEEEGGENLSKASSEEGGDCSGRISPSRWLSADCLLPAL